jgi:hypothetical protein
VSLPASLRCGMWSECGLVLEVSGDVDDLLILAEHRKKQGRKEHRQECDDLGVLLKEVAAKGSGRTPNRGGRYDELLLGPHSVHHLRPQHTSKCALCVAAVLNVAPVRPHVA